MKTKIFGALLCLQALSASLHGQAQEERHIRAVEEAIGKAIAEGDVAAYDQLASDDHQFITGNGVVMKKPERLALLKKGPSRGFTTNPETIRIYGDVAVVTGRQGMNAAARYSRVWVRQKGEWRSVLTHATAIAAPKP